MTAGHNLLNDTVLRGADILGGIENLLRCRNVIVGACQQIGGASDVAEIELPPEALGGLRNYVGGLAISADGETVAASSPVGGAILCINAATARPVSTTLLGSTCGVAADAQGFLASNGLGQLIGLGGSRAQERQFGFQFDEHLRRLMV